MHRVLLLRIPNRRSGRPELILSLVAHWPAAAPVKKKKLSYLEAREYATIEQRVEEAEELLQVKRAELEDPANAMDALRLVSAQAALEAAQHALDELYARWAELKKRPARVFQHPLAITPTTQVSAGSSPPSLQFEPELGSDSPASWRH